MISLSANRLVLQARVKLTEARARLAETESERPRPGKVFRVLEAREQVRYWERKVQEMISGG